MWGHHTDVIVFHFGTAGGSAKDSSEGFMETVQTSWPADTQTYGMLLINVVG